MASHIITGRVTEAKPTSLKIAVEDRRGNVQPWRVTGAKDHGAHVSDRVRVTGELLPTEGLPALKAIEVTIIGKGKQ